MGFKSDEENEKFEDWLDDNKYEEIFHCEHETFYESEVGGRYYKAELFEIYNEDMEYEDEVKREAEENSKSEVK